MTSSYCASAKATGRPVRAASAAAATGNGAVKQDLKQGRVAYQGAPGEAGQVLAEQLYPHLEPLHHLQLEDVFLALNNSVVEKALVPIENSSGGSIHEVLDLLLRYDVQIEGEAFTTTRLCLVAAPGTDLNNVERVLGDTSSLVQCDAYLRSLQDVRRETTSSSAEAAEVAVQIAKDENRRKDMAFIATEESAELYGLPILDHNIQDNKDGNITRFVLLTRNQNSGIPESEEPYKTSLVFSFPEEPGRLFNALSAFALREISLTKIESRPFRDKPIRSEGPQLGRRFQYCFYIDFLGSEGEARVKNAIRHLQEIAPFIKILGCYPVDKSQLSAQPPIVNGSIVETAKSQSVVDLMASVEFLTNPDELVLDKVETVAYQGMPGAYSESAVLAMFPNASPVPCEQFEDAFLAVSQSDTDVAVLPIENSLGGSIHAVYDLLIKYKLYIAGEVTIKVNHCLLALPGVKKTGLKRIISHYQALAQVDGYTRQLPVVREAVYDTAGAARMVADNDWRDTAAVASARAGELYGLEILDENIQDNKDNITRFLVLSRKHRVQLPSSHSICKTSVVFSLKDGPGELYKACSVFALRGLDMTKVESRPMRTRSPQESPSKSGAFQYLFYIDFVASLTEKKGQNALRHLRELAPFLRVLGCYPMDLQQ